MTAVMTFSTDGTAGCLYHELIDLHELGRLTCQRASVIEFDAASQEWQVRIPGATSVLFRHPSRSACLRWEQEHESLLGNRNPNRITDPAAA